MGNFCLGSLPFWKISKIFRSQGPRKSKMLANLSNLGGKRNKNAHSVYVLKCVHEDEGCREQWSSLGGHVSGHQHIISSHIHHQHLTYTTTTTTYNLIIIIQLCQVTQNMRS